MAKNVIVYDRFVIVYFEVSNIPEWQELPLSLGVCETGIFPLHF